MPKLVRMKKPIFHLNQFLQTVDEAYQILIAAFFFWIALGFLKSYRTSFWLKGLRNGSWTKLEVWKKHQFYFIEGTFFCTSNFDQLPFLSPLSYKEVTYLYRKPKAILNESSIQNWNSSFHSVRKLALTKSDTFSLKSVLSHCGWSFSHFYSWF